MSKKFVIAIFAAAFACLLIVGISFLHEVGMLKKRPEARYLTEDEESVRPIYSQLSDKEKAVYEALYRGISEHKENVALPYDIKGETYSKLYCIVEKQEGSLFYASSSFYTAKVVGKARIMYRDDPEEIERKIGEMRIAEKKALDMIGGAKNEQELARRIHDYLIRRCTYITGEDQPYSSTAYGCLVEGKANCEGYAKAFGLLASEVGLRSVLITGKTDKGENHAWNQVNIDGKWYNIDVTWDDTDVSGDIRKNYFLCSDDEFGMTHFADKVYFDPFKCEDNSKNYYVSNDLMINSLEKAETVLRREILAGNDVIELKFSNEDVYNDFKKRFIDDNEIFDLALNCGKDYDDRISVTISENKNSLCITLLLDHIKN